MNSVHPKEILYEEAYDPVVSGWFSRFEDSPLVDDTRQATKEQDLLTRVIAFDALFHTLVDEQIDAKSPPTKHALEVVREHAKDVMWAGQLVPPDDPSESDIEVSFRWKLKRNISLAYLEGLVVCGSASNFLRSAISHTEDVPDILKRSYRLIGGLAVLNDEHEIARLKELLETEDEISYPQTPFAEITSGNLQIRPDKFKLLDGVGGQSVAFNSAPKLSEIAPTRPTMRCPAHRLEVDGTRLNERFWHLLVDIHTTQG